MKNIVLFSIRVTHYRSRLYNVFYEMFLRNGYEFHVVSDSFDTVDFPIEYQKHCCTFSLKQCSSIIQELNPVVCIGFMTLKTGVFVRLPYVCRIKNTPYIFWGHGLSNWKYASARNLLYHLVHLFSSGIILYSKNQIPNVMRRNRSKIFVVNNTQSFAYLEHATIPSAEEVRAKYSIQERFVVLFVGRIQKRKKVDVLLKMFNNNTDIGIVIVGDGLTEDLQKSIDENPNCYYLGAKYGMEVDEIFKMADVFCSPGHIGLAINQAMYWGKPVVVMKGNHAPEICYLVNAENGYIVENSTELRERIQQLREDSDVYSMLSQGARDTYEKEMQVETMFYRFLQVVQTYER